MFIGHQAVAFALKRADPRRSLGTLMAGAMLLDLIWPIFLLAGWERVRIQPGNTAFTPLAFDWYPYSHSFVAALAWSAIFALVCRKASSKDALILAAAVFSHWILDAISHRPDLPLYPGNQTLVGLGLWSSQPATVIVEGLFFAIALWVYHTISLPRDGYGRWGYAAFVLLLLALYFGAAFGPPPPNIRALEFTGLAAWLLPFWAGWFDRHRSVVVN